MSYELNKPEEVLKDIFRIEVPLPNNPLRVMNSYFIRGKDRDLLIDTGFRRPECQQALEDGLACLGSDPDRRDVLITHLHSDHSGMADLFVGKGCRVYMHEKELEYEKLVLNSFVKSKQDARLVAEGFPEDLVIQNANTNPARTMALPAITDAFTPLKDGEVLQVGDYKLETICVPGHTPGQSIFWIAEQGVLFTADHILFDITPNITAWPEVGDTLGDYLDSLRRVRDLPVKVALPAHRKTGDYQKRVDTLLAHHEERLQEVLQIITDMPDATAYEIASRMQWRIRGTWDEFPTSQKFFAVGECLSHLDYFCKRHMVHRQNVDGVYRYTRV